MALTLQEIFRSELSNGSCNAEDVPENFYLNKIFSLNGELIQAGKLIVSHSEK